LFGIEKIGKGLRIRLLTARARRQGAAAIRSHP